MNKHLDAICNSILDFTKTKKVIGCDYYKVLSPYSNKEIIQHIHYARLELHKLPKEYSDLKQKIKWCMYHISEAFELVRGLHPITNFNSTDEYLLKLLENTDKELIKIFSGKSKWSDRSIDIVLEPCLILYPEDKRLGGLRIIIYVKNKETGKYVSDGYWIG